MGDMDVSPYVWGKPFPVGRTCDRSGVCCRPKREKQNVQWNPPGREHGQRLGLRRHPGHRDDPNQLHVPIKQPAPFMVVRAIPVRIPTPAISAGVLNPTYFLYREKTCQCFPSGFLSSTKYWRGIEGLVCNPNSCTPNSNYWFYSAFYCKKSPSMINNFTPFFVDERCELTSSETTYVIPFLIIDFSPSCSSLTNSPSRQ
jgi:hypothetical protein